MPSRSPGRDPKWRAKGLEEEYARLMGLMPKAPPAPQVGDARASSPCAASHGATSGAKAEAEAKGTVSVAVPTASGQVRLRISPGKPAKSTSAPPQASLMPYR